jgi:hypothetical protein
MIKDFLMRKMIESKLKDVPKDQQEKMIALVQKNPAFFQQIALEIQDAMKSGQNEMSAAMSVLEKNREAIQKIMNS